MRLVPDITNCPVLDDRWKSDAIVTRAIFNIPPELVQAVIGNHARAANLSVFVFSTVEWFKQTWFLNTLAKGSQYIGGLEGFILSDGSYPAGTHTTTARLPFIANKRAEQSEIAENTMRRNCLLYTSPSPRDRG